MQLTSHCIYVGPCCRWKKYATGRTPWVGDVERPEHGVEVMVSYPDQDTVLEPCPVLDTVFKDKQVKSVKQMVRACMGQLVG